MDHLNPKSLHFSQKATPSEVPTKDSTRTALVSAPSTATTTAAPRAYSAIFLWGSARLLRVEAGGSAAVVPPAWTANGIQLETILAGLQVCTGTPGRLGLLIHSRLPEWWSSMCEMTSTVSQPGTIIHTLTKVLQSTNFHIYTMHTFF